MRRTLTFVCAAAIVGAMMIAVAGLALAPLARASSGGAASASGASATSPVAEPSPSASPTLELTAAPATVTWGKATMLTIQLSLGAAPVRLSRRAAGAEVFTPVGDFTTGVTGVVTWSVVPRVTTMYRAEFIDDSQPEPISAEVTVSVRPIISFTAPGSVYKGQRARLSVRVRPAHPGGRVAVELWRDGAWTAWRTVTLDAQSRTLSSWRADRVGKQRLRVRMEADTEYAAGVSRVRWVTVRKPNPYGVPVSAKRIIVVDKSEYRTYFFSYGREIKSFPCVLGRPSLPTPLGHFRIYAKGMWPGGPFGARIMSYHAPYAIHGTNQPHLLSRFPRNFSHGCTRLANANAVWLYDHAPVGTPVWNVR